MKEIWEISTLPYMLPVTVALGLFVAFVLLSVLTGGIGEGIDFDLDGDVDLEASGGGFLDTFLHVVNADKVPTMLVFAVLSVFMWMSGVALTVLINPSHSNLIGLGVLALAFVVSVVLTRYMVKPFIPLFKMLKQGEDNGVKIEGCQGTVKSIEITEKFCQVEIIGCDGPVLLNARLREGEELLQKGDDVVVLERSSDGKFCYVAKLKI